MTPTKEERTYARRGAEYLDKVVGRSWRRKIKRRELSMVDPCHCVLGQLYGDYHEALEQLGLTYNDARLLGVDGGTGEDAWLEVLREG